MMKRNEKRKSNSSYFGPAILAALFIISSLANSGAGGAVIIPLLSFALIAGIIVFVFKILKKAKNISFSSGYKGYTEKKESSLEDKSLSSGTSGSPAVYNPRSAEELFLRDKQKRLEQLDVFLKNGIVDKAEYNLLKKRYENYSYERN